MTFQRKRWTFPAPLPSTMVRYSLYSDFLGVFCYNQQMIQISIKFRQIWIVIHLCAILFGEADLIAIAAAGYLRRLRVDKATERNYPGLSRHLLNWMSNTEETLIPFTLYLSCEWSVNIRRLVVNWSRLEQNRYETKR